MLFRDLQIGRCRHDENFTEVVRTNLNRLICWINSVDAGTMSQSSSGAQSKIKNRTITKSSFQCQSKLKPVLQIEHEFAKFKSPIWSKLKKEKFCSELSKSLKLLKLENWTCTFMNCCPEFLVWELTKHTERTLKFKPASFRLYEYNHRIQFIEHYSLNTANCSRTHIARACHEHFEKNYSKLFFANRLKNRHDARSTAD